MLAFHVAYDYTKLSSSQGGGHASTIGLGRTSPQGADGDVAPVHKRSLGR